MDNLTAEDKKRDRRNPNCSIVMSFNIHFIHKTDFHELIMGLVTIFWV